MKFAWRKKVIDHAALNWARNEQVELEEYGEILDADELSTEWDKELHAVVDEYIYSD
jgi:squalene cyclase